MNTPTSRRRSAGFTLIELLVVIAILAVLAAILIPNFTNARKKPYDVAALQCGKAIVTAQITYMSEHNNSPAGSISQLNNQDVTEQCTDVQVMGDGNAVPNVGAGGNGSIAVGGTNYAFRVWSQNGVSIYYYNKDGGARLIKDN